MLKNRDYTTQSDLPCYLHFATAEFIFFFNYCCSTVTAAISKHGKTKEMQLEVSYYLCAFLNLQIRLLRGISLIFFC